ncbi:tyrosine-protein phosphatase [Gymnodinialimonas sp. 2305UL16-5]|uniref:tyrosine-protein phosphatase n=1 Tax=Gymnodinialimonas mytili TaxID=3126503 RepID=UPI00309A56F0
MDARPSTAPLPFTPRQRLRFYWLRDHGFLRAIWRNFYRLDDEVWRHNHPSPARLAKLKAMGAASVLSLRGEGAPVSVLEAGACHALNLPFRGIGLSALTLPEPQALLELLDALRTMPKPVVVHCKSGSDRTGLAATLYLHVIKGVPLDQARRQLALRYIHNRWGGAGIVHALLDAYAAAHADTGIEFEDWVQTAYDPAALSKK